MTDRDNDKILEIKKFACKLVDEIEEKIQNSDELKKEEKFYESPHPASVNTTEVNLKQFDNNTKVITPLEANNRFGSDNILKFEPEVPIKKTVITALDEGKTLDTNGVTMLGKKDNLRRKSDLGLIVIKENLEMLNKLSQKTAELKEVKGHPTQPQESKDGSGKLKILLVDEMNLEMDDESVEKTAGPNKVISLSEVSFIKVASI